MLALDADSVAAPAVATTIISEPSPFEHPKPTEIPPQNLEYFPPVAPSPRPFVPSIAPMTVPSQSFNYIPALPTFLSGQVSEMPRHIFPIITAPTFALQQQHPTYHIRRQPPLSLIHNTGLAPSPFFNTPAIAMSTTPELQDSHQFLTEHLLFPSSIFSSPSGATSQDSGFTPQISFSSGPIVTSGGNFFDENKINSFLAVPFPWNSNIFVDQKPQIIYNENGNDYDLRI
ncbi:hypothetical protein HK100_007609 [Physocladia obscura]|uniref:Uncharacterized protein n=1 Tax=Physocladia obscura TaxID=109957 RepID=A0AAD5XHA6_9FUNG|nr:hypothetical protein HK100_007609 [Physocladia obscura]